jgi:hypothetical protein
MMFGLLNDTHAEDFSDIGPLMRILLVVLMVIAILALTGCAASSQVKPVDRHPPAADMVRLDPLPHQTDPTLGGIFRGYVNAAQQYRGCVDRLTELQDWVLNSSEAPSH